MSFPTLTESKRAKVARMEASVEALSAELAAYAREHGGHFILFGSAARGEMRHDSDVDVLVDFPSDRESDAWLYAEDRAVALGLKPDIHLKGTKRPAFLAQVEADAAGESVAEKVWDFVLDSARSAERHFAAAVDIFEKDAFDDERDGYMRVMAFLHAMQSGHTSFEAALRRALRALDEDLPSGERWHEALIDQCAAPVRGGRPAILPARLAELAHATRSFRHFASHSYDVVFDDDKARTAVEAARELGPQILPALERFVIGLRGDRN